MAQITGPDLKITPPTRLVQVNAPKKPPKEPRGGATTVRAPPITWCRPIRGTPHTGKRPPFIRWFTFWPRHRWTVTVWGHGQGYYDNITTTRWWWCHTFKNRNLIFFHWIFPTLCYDIMSHRLIYYDVFFLYVKRNIINTDQSYGLCQLCGSNHHCDKCVLCVTNVTYFLTSATCVYLRCCYARWCHCRIRWSLVHCGGAWRLWLTEGQILKCHAVTSQQRECDITLVSVSSIKARISILWRRSPETQSCDVPAAHLTELSAHFPEFFSADDYWQFSLSSLFFLSDVPAVVLVIIVLAAEEQEEEQRWAGSFFNVWGSSWRCMDGGGGGCCDQNELLWIIILLLFIFTVKSKIKMM